MNPYSSQTLEIMNLVQKKIRASISDQNILVSIADRKGIIISGEGTSSELFAPALKAAQIRQPVITAGDLPCDGVCGCVPFFYNQEVIGVIVLASSGELPPCCLEMAALTAESIYELELCKSPYLGKLDLQKDFSRSLLYYPESPVPAAIFDKAEKLGIQPDIIRIAIIFELRYNTYSQEKLTLEFLKNPLHGKQDILCMTKGMSAVVFKAIASSPEAAIADYRSITGRYIEEVKKLDINHGKPFLFGIGSLQNKLTNYYKSFQHALWLSNYSLNTEHGSSNYFYDHLLPYIQSFTSMDEFHAIFNVYREILSQSEQQQFIKKIDCLYQHNLNLSASAEDLFLHRNTLSAWLNRTRDTFHLDPLNSESDREFLQQLLYYYKNTCGASY